MCTEKSLVHYRYARVMVTYDSALTYAFYQSHFILALFPTALILQIHFWVGQTFANFRVANFGFANLDFANFGFSIFGFANLGFRFLVLPIWVLPIWNRIANFGFAKKFFCTIIRALPNGTNCLKSPNLVKLAQFA